MAKARRHATIAPVTHRLRIRPVLYPAGLLVGFVLYLVVQTGVSPWAAGRPMLAAVGLGLVLPWLFGLLTGDRDQAGVLAIIVALLLLAGQQPLAAMLLLGLLIAVATEPRWRGGRARGIRWPVITQAMTAVAAVVLVAVGITSLQDGRVVRMADDLVAEAGFGRGTPAAQAGRDDLPSIYLLLLDGYPRADKLAIEFGIDNSQFISELRSLGFTVADRSRSNHVATDLTLASIFNGSAPADLEISSAEYRPHINEGAVLHAVRDLGYEVVSVSSGVEGVSLRRVDRFVDTGQLNEFEYNLIRNSGLVPVLDVLAPTLHADLHRARIDSTFAELQRLAAEPSQRPRFTFAHVLSPHSPQVFDATGSPIEIRGFAVLSYPDRRELEILGREEYVRRLGGQITYLNSRVLGAVDAIVRSDGRAVIVVFSDHGSGIRELHLTGQSDVDLRTANLLAVRSPGASGIIDDRSTLVNVLPRILRAHAGSGPADMPETIYGLNDVNDISVVFERPD